MDFGDILDEWDEVQGRASRPAKGRQQSHKKANAPTPEEKEAARQGYAYERQMAADNQRRANPVEVWLNRYGTIDKDRLADEAAENSRLHNLSYLKQLKPQATLDLHGLTREEGWERLQSFVDDCARRGLKKILVIHGKGQHSHGSDPILGPMVRLFIEQDKRLGTSGHPDRNHGGSGATWVIIKS